MPTTASLSYSAQTTTTATVSLEVETRISQVSGNDRIEKWVNLDKDAQPQIETLTIDNALPVADCYYRVAIDGATANAERVYMFEFLTASSDTSNTIAQKLAELIDTNADVSAVASTNTVAITSVTPGTNGAFTATVSCKAKADDTTIASKITTASTQAASGTGKLRKLAQLDISFAVNSDGKPELKVQDGVWYTGANPAVALSSFGPFPFTGGKKLDDYRAVA